MAVYCLQVVDGEPSEEQVIPPPVEGYDDATTLRVKAESAAEKGWDVEWLSPTSFVARKVRWLEAAMCERIFRVE
jgi:hypothetical protein